MNAQDWSDQHALAVEYLSRDACVEWLQTLADLAACQERTRASFHAGLITAQRRSGSLAIRDAAATHGLTAAKYVQPELFG